MGLETTETTFSQEHVWDYCRKCSRKLRHELSKHSGYCGLCFSQIKDPFGVGKETNTAEKLLLLMADDEWVLTNDLILATPYHRKALYSRMRQLESKGYVIKKVDNLPDKKGRYGMFKLTPKGETHKKFLGEQKNQ